MGKAVLLIVTLKGCGGCVDLKRNLPSIENEVKDIVKVIPIEVSSMGERIPDPYPASINSLSGTFYPTLIMIPSTDWERAVVNPKTFKFTRFQIMDGTIENGRPKYTSDKLATPRQIVDWVYRTEPLLESRGSSNYRSPEITKLPEVSSNDSYDNPMNYAVCGIKYLPSKHR